MVAVKTHEADRFITSRARHIYLYLVHGNDAGLISERTRALTRLWASDPLQIVRLNGDDISADPLLLLDEANAIGLFGGDRAIVVSAGAKNLVAALENLIAAPPRDCVVIIEAGSLKKDSALRKLVERLKEGASIECYPDSARDVERLIDTEVRAAGLRIEPEAVQTLIHLLGADRLTTRAELSKLVLYAHGRETITRKDVDDLVADASSLALDDAVNGAFNGDPAEVEDTARRFFATGGDGSTLLGSALRHALTLHRMCLDAESGISAENLPAKYGRFFGSQGLVQQIRKWPSVRVARAVSILAEAVNRTRREPNLNEAIAVRALWSVALAARARS